MKKEYVGIMLFGQNAEFAGRGIAGPRLRTAAAKENFNIKIIDYINYLGPNHIFDILEKLITDNTKFVGFSASWIDQNTFNRYAWYSQEWFDELRSRWPNIKIITGGHDDFKKDFLLKNSDWHFHGYSDKSFVEFLKMIHGIEHNLSFTRNVFGKGNYINSNLQYPIENPDDLETVFEAEDNFKSFQPLPIEIARGCIFRCGFCRHPFQGKKDYDSYQRTPESIARELKRNYELFGTTRYTILDDTFNDSVEKISRVKKAIKLSGIPNFEFVAYIKPELLVTKPEMIPMLNEIGLKGAFIGFESFHPKARQQIGKGTKIEKILDACKHLAEYNGKVLIHGSFIIGLPYETKEDILKTFNFLKSSENTFIRSWHVEPLNVRDISSLNKFIRDMNTDMSSTFDKNAAELGYKFDSTGSWRNEHWSYIDAKSLAKDILLESASIIKNGGWRVAGLWQAGFTEEYIQQSFCLQDILKILHSQSNDRASLEYFKIVGKRKL
jgi:hypothetical protein